MVLVETHSINQKKCIDIDLFPPLLTSSVKHSKLDSEHF